jgi:hypothetical protein
LQIGDGRVKPGHDEKEQFLVADHVKCVKMKAASAK